MQKVTAFSYLVFPNSPVTVIPKITSSSKEEPIEHGIITSVTHGVMPGTKTPC
jgi:exosome complex component RRP46